MSGRLCTKFQCIVRTSLKVQACSARQLCNTQTVSVQSRKSLVLEVNTVRRMMYLPMLRFTSSHVVSLVRTSLITFDDLSCHSYPSTVLKIYDIGDAAEYNKPMWHTIDDRLGL